LAYSHGSRLWTLAVYSINGPNVWLGSKRGGIDGRRRHKGSTQAAIMLPTPLHKMFEWRLAHALLRTTLAKVPVRKPLKEPKAGKPTRNFWSLDLA